MRLLFEIDKKDYISNGSCGKRPSVRGIIIKQNELAMIHSLKYDYYKFPGGGMESLETQKETLIREVKEEAGLNVKPDSIKEFGMVHRVQKGNVEDIFIQDNFYYLCEVAQKMEPQSLDDYEAEEKFTLEFVTPQYAISVNKTHNHFEATEQPMLNAMIERENKVLDILINEKYF